MKKLLTVLLACCMLFGAVLPAAAADDAINNDNAVNTPESSSSVVIITENHQEKTEKKTSDAAEPANSSESGARAEDAAKPEVKTESETKDETAEKENTSKPAEEPSDSGAVIIVDADNGTSKADSSKEPVSVTPETSEKTTTEAKPAAKHRHSIKKIIEEKEPNCTEKGFIRYICECGKECLKVLAPKHQYVNGVCSICKAVQGSESADGCSHDYEISDKTNATCTKKGSIQYRCTECGDVYSIRTAKLGHKFENGVCVRCGASEEPATDGSSDSQNLLNEAPAESGENVSSSCADGHSYEVTEKQEPGCETPGYISYCCTECGDTLTEPLPAASHCYENGKCKVCGAPEPELVDFNLIPAVQPETVDLTVASNAPESDAKTVSESVDGNVKDALSANPDTPAAAGNESGDNGTEKPADAVSQKAETVPDESKKGAADAAGSDEESTKQPISDGMLKTEDANLSVKKDTVPADLKTVAKDTAAGALDSGTEGSPEDNTELQKESKNEDGSNPDITAAVGQDAPAGTLSMPLSMAPLLGAPSTPAVSITPKDPLTKAYDGTALVGSYETAGDLRDTDEWVVTRGEATYVGDEPYAIAARSIRNKTTHADVTADYSITEINYKLSITPRTAKITVTAGSGTAVYDGTAHTVGYTVSGTLANGDTLSVDIGVEGTGLVDGKAVHAGSYTTKIASYKVYRGTKDVTDCYSDISTATGTLTIDPREIKFTSKAVSKIYDGTPLLASVSASDVLYKSGNFVNDDSCEPVKTSFTGSQTDAGQADNVFDLIFKPGTGSISLESDYKITKVYGKLTVEKRPVLLQSLSATKKYDGKPLTKEMVAVGGSGFVSGQGADYIDFASRTSVGTTENTFNYVLWSNTKKDNYTISREYGKLKVTGGSTRTGVEDYWPLYFGVAAVLLIVIVVLVIRLVKNRKKNEQ